MINLLIAHIAPQSVPVCVAPCPVGHEPQSFNVPVGDRSFILLPANASAAQLKAAAETIKANCWEGVTFCTTADRKNPVASAHPAAWVKKLIDLPEGAYVLREW